MMVTYLSMILLIINIITDETHRCFALCVVKTTERLSLCVYYDGTRLCMEFRCRSVLFLCKLIALMVLLTQTGSVFKIHRTQSLCGGIHELKWRFSVEVHIIFVGCG